MGNWRARSSLAAPLSSRWSSGWQVRLGKGLPRDPTPTPNSWLSALPSSGGEPPGDCPVIRPPSQERGSDGQGWGVPGTDCPGHAWTLLGGTPDTVQGALEGRGSRGVTWQVGTALWAWTQGRRRPGIPLPCLLALCFTQPARAESRAAPAPLPPVHPRQLERPPAPVGTPPPLPCPVGDGPALGPPRGMGTSKAQM